MTTTSTGCLKNYPAFLIDDQNEVDLNAYSDPALANVARTSSPILTDSTLPGNGSSLKLWKQICMIIISSTLNFANWTRKQGKGQRT